MATLIPEPEEFQATLKLLLELSDRPRDVKIVSVQAIEAPEETVDRYLRFQLIDVPSEENPEPPKKRGPGRPRKNPLPEEQV